MSSALEITGLTKTYASGVEALKNVDLRIESGDFFALIGPNGAGKSTLIGVVCGLVKKTEGQVAVFGYDLDTETSSAKRSVGVVPQEFNCNIFEKCLDIVATQAGYFGIPRKTAYERAERLLSELGLRDKLHVPSRELSGGMKRRLLIARALVHQPQLLILDEPTAGVDVELRKEMWVYLKKLSKGGVTIVLTTHYLEEAEALCNKLAIIHQGEIKVSGNMADVLGGRKLEDYFLSLTST